MSALHDRIIAALKQLRLSTLRHNLDMCLDAAGQQEMSHIEFLDCILTTEMKGREAASHARRQKAARFPVARSLEAFDFVFQASVKKSRMANLADCRWIEQSVNLLFEGPPGVGKTHLAIALGHKAVEQGYRVYFIEAEDLLQQMYAYAAAGEIDTFFKKLLKHDCIIIDEFAYLPLDAHAGNYLYQLIHKCYENVSLVITTNKGVEAWAEMFQDQAISQAILDRYLHHCEVFHMIGDSYRINGPDSSDEESGEN